MGGQINRGSPPGDLIYELSKDKNNMIFVELGTWNGQGSTKCFMDAILERGDDSVLYSMESSSVHFNQAKDFWDPILSAYKKQKLILMLGRIIEVAEMATTEQVIASPVAAATLAYPQWTTWHKNYTTRYPDVNNVYKDLPESIDVLLLDGGDFSSYAGWKKLEDRTKIVLLDDANVFKNYRVNQEIVSSPDWELLKAWPSYAHGFMAYKRK
jgi:hypothetical protein